MKLKKSTKKQIKDTAYAEVPFPVTEMNSIRIALYDNAPLKPKSENSTGRFVIEVNTEFDTPQQNWQNQTQIQLRNRTSQLTNIKYKLPASASEQYQNWYNEAFNEMQMFEIDHPIATTHCKLGTRLRVGESVAFRSVLGAVASLAWDEDEDPVILLQMGEAMLDSEDNIFIDGFSERLVLEDKRVHNNMILWQGTFELDD
jgi:hypothetical protein